MKIECLLHRKGGSYIDLPPKVYHFAPQEDGKHVADVEDPDHIARLLSIREGYRMLGAADIALEQSKANARALDPAADDLPDLTGAILLGSDVFPATFEINGKTYQLGAIVARACLDAKLDADAWNGLTQDARDVKIEAVLDGIEDGEITDVVALPEATDKPEDKQGDAAAEESTNTPAQEGAALSADAERAALATQYKAAFGKAPPSNMTLDNLRKKVAEGKKE